MRHFPVAQGSREWAKLRCGKATASNFDKLITAKKHEPTKGETRRAYAIFLLTELILDEPLSGATTASMNHGTAYEENARAAYEMLIGEEVEPCGFCTNDEQTYGASPDAFVGKVGLAEFKAPFKPEVHVGYMMNPQSLVDEYFIQVQGELFVCKDRQWADLISYVGTMPMVKVRVLPDPVFLDKLGVALRSFCADFSDLVRRAVDLGYLKETPPTTDWIQADDVNMARKRKQTENDFDVTDSDLSRIFESRRSQ